MRIGGAGTALVFGVTLVVVAACGRHKPGQAPGTGGAVGSGGRAATGGATATGGHGGAGATPAATGGLGAGGSATAGVSGSGGGAGSGNGGSSSGGTGTGGRTVVGGSGGASSWDAGVDDPPCTFVTPPATCSTAGARCVLAAFSELCIECIGGSRLWRPQPLISGPVLCMCIPGGVNAWQCPGVTGPSGDCHVESGLSCTDAEGLFVDDHCTQPAPCTP